MRASVGQETHLIPAGGCHAVEVALVGRATAVGDTAPGAIAPVDASAVVVLHVGVARCVCWRVDTATGAEVHLAMSQKKGTRKDGGQRQ